MFKERLVEIRKNNDLTQEELANILCVTRQAVSKWERGICYPDIEILKRISTLYKVPLDSLLEIVKHEKSNELIVIAKKSYGMIIIFLLVSLLCLYGGTVALNRLDYYASIFFICSVVSFLIALPYLLLPRELIKANDYGIAFKKHFVKYEEIVEVKGIITHS